MVCKRSLYCWKNGPCASDQTRKQIWEDNIKFRESLRDLNQSDSFWSFQISKNSCLCLEGEDFYCGRPLSRRYRTGSLQRLHQIDCTSVTHDFNGLKFRNCFVHCPIHDFSKNEEPKRIETPLPQSPTKKANGVSCLKYPLRPLHKSDDDVNEYCQRYKNTLSKCSLKPTMKTKFASQSNLNAVTNKSTLGKKSFHASCENIIGRKQESRTASPVTKIEKTKSGEDVNIRQNEKKKEDELEVQKEKLKCKRAMKELKPMTPVPDRDTLHGYTPVSRTTRKMLNEHKQVPFLTYGCNNNNLDIGSKRTHNVLASKLEVYPNALLAKQQKKDLILKYMQSEKEFQRRCLPDELKRRHINHSSLWSVDFGRDKSFQKKTTKHSLPLMVKPPKKLGSISNQFDSAPFKTYRKPEIYFY